MYVCVRVCHHQSPVDSFLCVYVSICMLTPLNDCNYIRQYLFHQCATSLLSRDSRIADYTVRHPGVERPFSSLLLGNQQNIDVYN